MSSLERRKIEHGFTFVLRFRDGAGKQHSRSLKTSDLKTAKRIQSQVDAELAKRKWGLVESRKRISLSEFRKLYISKYSVVNKSQRTVELDNGALKTFERYIGDRRLSEITPEIVEGFKADRILNVRPTTLNIELRCIKAALNLAVEWDYLKSNPLKKTKQLRVPESKNPKFIDLIQLQAFLNSINDVVHLALFSFYASTGARRNEALGVKWEDVDFDKNVIILKKTKGSKTRLIPMRSKLKLLLIDLPHQSEYLFPLKPNYTNKIFKIYAKKAGLPKHFTVHSLRHSFLSYIVSSSGDIRAAQELAGHSSISVTEIYSHPFMDDLREIVESLPY